MSKTISPYVVAAMTTLMFTVPPRIDIPTTQRRKKSPWHTSNGFNNTNRYKKKNRNKARKDRR
jgi:hypothetical protein